MTRDEIVTALRQCPRYGVDCSKGVCAFFKPDGAFEDCIKKKNDAAADLIENQQRHIEALLQANDALRDTVLRRDAQIEKMSAELADARNEIKKFYNGCDQLDASNSRLMAANEKLAADCKALINELCQYCGKYKQAHEGACDGCRWRGM